MGSIAHNELNGRDATNLHAANIHAANLHAANLHAANIHAANIHTNLHATIDFYAFHDCLPNHYPYLHAYSVSAYRRHAFEDEHAHASEGQHASEEGIEEGIQKGIKEGNEKEKGML